MNHFSKILIEWNHFQMFDTLFIKENNFNWESFSLILVESLSSCERWESNFPLTWKSFKFFYSKNTLSINTFNQLKKSLTFHFMLNYLIRFNKIKIYLIILLLFGLVIFITWLLLIKIYKFNKIIFFLIFTLIIHNFAVNKNIFN